MKFPVILLVVATLAAGCATRNPATVLAHAASPNPLLPQAAMECAQLPTEASQRTCLVGVKVEAERAGRTAEAAALAEFLRNGGWRDGYYYGGEIPGYVTPYRQPRPHIVCGSRGYCFEQ